jgi:2,3-bisphosphoglycerate-independent phosphoglycerate mutase
MKYIVILGDGMSDYPLEVYGGQTPLQRAKKPVIDSLAQCGLLGLVKTVPAKMAPGSDTANLSVLGYDPRIYYSGRSPFEAASMGVKLADDDMAFRCNLVTLSLDEPYAEKVMLDHSADEISSEEARELIELVSGQLGSEHIRFYPGVSYRHLMVWSGGPSQWQLTPPHDILGKKIGPYLPQGPEAALIEAMMVKSAEFLAGHAVNKQRIAQGKKPANSAWIWGEGKRPQLSSFYEKYGIKGSVISAVDLIKGIGLLAGLNSINVPGATGTIHTNFRGKAQAALKALLEEGKDFVYLHIEAPDECGHRQETENKVRAIELIDEQVVRVIKDGLDKSGKDYSMLIMPDHATPLSLRTHTTDPVPFLIYRNDDVCMYHQRRYDEESAADTGIYIKEGHTLMDQFIAGV